VFETSLNRHIRKVHVRCGVRGCRHTFVDLELRDKHQEIHFKLVPELRSHSHGRKWWKQNQVPPQVQQSGSAMAIGLESEALHKVPDSRPELTMSGGEPLEVPDSQPEWPELTMSDGEMLEVPDSQPEGPELTMSGSEMLEYPALNQSGQS
jgi:hypothetical protein